MEFEVEEQAGVVRIDEGVYPARLVKIERRQIETKDGDKRDVLFWTFKVRTREGPVELQGLTSTKISTGINPSKAYRWACVLLGRELKVGEKFTEDDLVGKECLAIVEDRKTSVGVVSRVVDIKKARKVSKKAVEEEEEEEEEEDIPSDEDEIEA